MRYLIYLFCALYFCVGRPAIAGAEPSVEEQLREMKTQFYAMQEKIAANEKRINELEAQLAKEQGIRTVAVAEDHPIEAQVIPDITVVADTLVKLDSSKEDVDGNNRLSLRELVLMLGHEVDASSRLDAIISFSDTESPSLEEAYLTHTGLPWEATARIGRIKPQVGKVLGIHRHDLDTVDEPLVIQRYFGAEGMSKSGVDFAKSIDSSGRVTQRLVAGVLEGGNGDGGTAFGTSSRAPTLYSHWANELDVNDSAHLELGFSHMIGSRDEHPGFESQVLASDLTLIKQLAGQKSLKLQLEGFNLNRRKSIDVDGNLWGAYGLVDFRFHPRWSTGLRYDYAQLVDNPASNPRNADLGESGYLTFHQGELARWRLQYSHANLATGKDNNTVYLQGTFAIGKHKE